MHRTRVAVVIDVPITHLEDSINRRLEGLETERHNVEILNVRVEVVRGTGVTEPATRYLAMILYRDAGSAEAADEVERRSADAFNTMYRDSIH